MYETKNNNIFLKDFMFNKGVDFMLFNYDVND